MSRKARLFTCRGARRGECGQHHRLFVRSLECIGRDIRATTRAGEVISDRMPVTTDGSELTPDEQERFKRWESSPW